MQMPVTVHSLWTYTVKYPLFGIGMLWLPHLYLDRSVLYTESYKKAISKKNIISLKGTPLVLHMSKHPACDNSRLSAVALEEFDQITLIQDDPDDVIRVILGCGRDFKYWTETLSFELGACGRRALPKDATDLCSQKVFFYFISIIVFCFSMI